MPAIAKLAWTAFDCPDPRALADFYGGILGWPIDEENSDDGWVELDSGGPIRLAFQRVEGYVAPRWPSQDGAQQAHLDLRVDDLDEAERQVLALGARKHEFQPGRTFRVYLDPVDHPFCLIQSAD